MIDKTNSSKLLRIIASMLDDISDKELEKLLSGESKLISVPVTDQKIKKESAQPPETDNIVRDLNESQSREEAREILSRVSNKESLTTIARSQKLHITKQDRREDIENKIVEFFIGAKLRTDAIKTLNMQGGSDKANK